MAAVFAAAMSLAPSSAALAQEDDLDFILSVLEEDYAGWETKTAEGREAEFEEQVALARQRVAEHPEARLWAFAMLLEWFRDDHLGLRANVVWPDNPWADQRAEGRKYDFVPALVDEFAVTRLSDDTIMVRAPDFFVENAETFAALLAEHHEEITSTPNLLIDIRGNRGGGDLTYAPLMAYLYTRPIYGIAPEIRATPRNLATLQENVSSGEYGAEVQEFVANILARAAETEGEWVPMFADGFVIETYPQVHELPKRVGILTEGAGSSGDQFVIDARFSSKVTLLGAPTAGVIDYSNMITMDAPSGEFALAWPMTRSMRLPEEPFDNVGVPVDVPYPDGVTDQVQWAQDWLERQVD